MNIDELRQALAFLFVENARLTLSLYFILKTRNGAYLRTADLNQEAQNDLLNRMLSSIQQRVIQNGDLRVSNLSDSSSMQNLAMLYDLDLQPEGFSLIQRVTNNEDQTNFNSERDRFEDIQGFVFYIGNAQHRVLLYKHNYQVSVISREKTFMIMKDRERLDVVKGDILQIRDTFDLMYVQNEFIIFNLKPLELHFGVDAVIRREAANRLTLIDASNILDSIEPLQNISEELRYSKKVLKLRSDTVVLQLPFDEIKRFIKGHPKLTRRLRFNQAGDRISLDTKMSIDLFLKLLDDAFLKSDLTQNQYESEEKNLLTSQIED